MTKADIVRKVSQATGLENESAKAAVEATMEAIMESVMAKEPVYLRGFGTFGIKHRAAKAARDIARNTTVHIPAKDIPSFKPCKAFRID